MKKIATILLCLIVSLSVTGQTQLFSGQQKDSVVRINPQMQKFDFVPGEVLVKFRDGVTVNFKNSRKGLKSSQAFMNRLINKYGIVDGERLFPNEKRLKSVQILTAPNGYKFKRPSLNNIYKLKLNSSDPRQLHESIRALKADSAQVEYAEPNYIYSIVDDKPESPALSESDMKALLEARDKSTIQLHDTVMPNDPLYKDQWNIRAIKADQVWKQTKGSKTQIIAILDTGVDWKHPDLQHKIWTNPDEIPGNGIDDDGDGYVDDVRGWDWINNDNNPTDDNSHGTHVAGIAAAETNNGIGIAGVDWNAEIMPLKVFQSSGRGDAATISKAIVYASNKGATAINMSFGSYALSLTMRDALANAYANSILVAAAGNDGRCIGPGAGCAPFFPAALSFVLGVQSPEASFSNYDQDGPTFSLYPALWNYEMKAPGTNIISTIPGGNYREYSGTSMASPLVSGAVALYKTKHPFDSQELMWGNLINTSTNYLQIDSAIYVKPKPVINFVSDKLVDTLAGDNNNGFVDAGETIQLWFKVRNTWGQSDSIYVGLRFGEFEDTTTAQILKDTAFIGSISPYAIRTNETNPLLIHISPTIANNRDIVFQGLLWYKGSKDTIKQSIIFNVENGIELNGMLGDTLTLTKDKLWLVTGSFRIAPLGVLIIKPGTRLIIRSKIVNDGKIIAIGKPDSLIIITGTHIIGGGGLIGAPGYIDFKYTDLNLTYYEGNVGAIEGQYGIINHSRITLNGWYGLANFSGEISESVLSNWMATSAYFYLINNLTIKNCNISNLLQPINQIADISFENNNFNRIGTILTSYTGVVLFTKPNNIVSLSNSQLFRSGSGYFQYETGQYWGTSDSVKIENKIYDFLDDASLSRVIFSPYLKQPSDSAHGIVWKVLVDSIDPQDQAKLMNPIGVGPHRFDVYFNRPMDTAYTPHLSFGVRYPYNQQSVADSGRWSHNNTVWTAYKTIKLYTGDGINRIRVSGARDPEGFEIPVEDMRFQFVISAAESSSVDFMATPGLGKVNLEWNNSGLKDLLGFNMYRMQQLNDTTLSSPVLVNKKLILDTLFTDFNVVPNKKYYYFYKVVNTDFSESDSSRVVAATPFTAALGDANGDLKVNILDLTSIVAYILGKNPQPFIKAAADVNGDSTINVLDIISIVKLILGTKETTASNSAAATPATIRMNDSTIQLESDHQLAALQFELKGDSLNQVKLSLLLKGFEFSYGIVNGKLIGLVYSFTGNMIPGGLQNIIKIDHAPGELKWGKVFGSDIMGKYVEVTVETVNGIKQPIILKNGLMVSPNPFNTSVVLKYLVSRRSHVQIEVYNLNGQKVSTLQNSIQNTGKYEIVWDGKTGGNRLLPSGIYFCRMFIVPENGGPAFKKDVKLIKMR